MLDALSMLARLNGHETIGLVHERDAILDQLGVVRVPEVPLPALGTKTAGTSQPSRTGREG
jgi:hypothetical protein